MTDKPLSYCPGCGHGTAHRILMEVIEEMDIQSETIGVAPVGCSVLAYDFMNVDMVGAAHGRAPAVATGIKRCWPDKFVYTYQGDGDLAAIGTAETIHAANRGENITVIFINNGIYGMTGGQMAPTTLEGMKTSTSPYGRDLHSMGNPLKMTELLAQLSGVHYVTRQSVHSPRNVRRAKKAIRAAFEVQKAKKGFSLVEIVSNCNSGWKLEPVPANEWMEEHMFPYYPLGDIKVDGKLIVNQ
jgi:2-oxoglutarate ferredoxin oxidoreductase subunit beta